MLEQYPDPGSVGLLTGTFFWYHPCGTSGVTPGIYSKTLILTCRVTLVKSIKWSQKCLPPRALIVASYASTMELLLPLVLHQCKSASFSRIIPDLCWCCNKSRLRVCYIDSSVQSYCKFRGSPELRSLYSYTELAEV